MLKWWLLVGVMDAYKVVGAMQRGYVVSLSHLQCVCVCVCVTEREDMDAIRDVHLDPKQGESYGFVMAER